MFKQGKKFEQNQKKYEKIINKKNLNLISVGQLNIIDNLKSSKYANISENFTGSVEMNAVDQKNLEETEKLQKLEGEFNQSMGQYTTLYKKYLKELAERQTYSSSLRSIVVKYSDSIYYINNKGIARQFTASSWTAKDSSCPGIEKTLSDAEFSKLTVGPPMNVGEICGPGALNVKDENNGTAAWVDNQGYKHVYTDFINRNKSCPATAKSITGIQFNAMPQGAAYGSNDRCELSDLESPTYDQLVVLNGKLMEKVLDMKLEVNKLATDDVNLDKNIKKQKSTLLNTYSELNQMKKKLKKMNTAIQSYKAEVEDQNLSVPSIQMHHLIWVIMGGAFMATAIYNS